MAATQRSERMTSTMAPHAVARRVSGQRLVGAAIGRRQPPPSLMRPESVVAGGGGSEMIAGEVGMPFIPYSDMTSSQAMMPTIRRNSPSHG
jgi:hypothetical protein